MTDLNSVSLTGRITKDAVMSTFADGRKVANFAIAVNRDVRTGDGKYDERVVFIPLALFDRRAEGLLPYLTKGRTVGVQGHVVQNTWEKDGVRRSALQVVVDKFIPFLGGGQKGGETESQVIDGQDFVEAPEDFIAPPVEDLIF